MNAFFSSYTQLHKTAYSHCPSPDILQKACCTDGHIQSNDVSCQYKNQKIKKIILKDTDRLEMTFHKDQNNPKNHFKLKDFVSCYLTLFKTLVFNVPARGGGGNVYSRI